jgi:hypothetical protein
MAASSCCTRAVMLARRPDTSIMTPWYAPTCAAVTDAASYTSAMVRGGGSEVGR